jgi:hypothetical protein
MIGKSSNIFKKESYEKTFCNSASLWSNSDTNLTKQFGTSDYDQGYSVATDSSGNVFVTGRTDGSLSGSNLGSSDIFLTKYDGAGNEIWKKQFGTSDSDVGYSVATDSSGNVFVTGSTGGSLSGSNLGSSDIFLTKYDGAGNEIWKKQFGTSDSDVGYSVATDSSGNVFVTGSTGGSLSGSNLGSSDIFLTKYDGAGNEIWKKQFGTSDSDFGYSVATDSLGDVFVTGRTDGSLSGSNFGSADIFLTKYDGSGNEIWIKQFGTSTDEFQNIGGASAISGNSIFLTGYTLGSFDGFSNAGSSDVFLSRFSIENEILLERNETLLWGDENCSFGGLKIESGADENNNSVLDDFEISNTVFQCLNSPDYLEKNVSVPFGSENCPFGGNERFLGLDKNRDGILENDEANETILTCFTFENSPLFEKSDFVHIKNGWNLVALDINLSEISSDISIIWQFENEIWSAFSPNGEYSSAISSQGISTISENLKSENGTWVLSGKELVLQKEPKIATEISPIFPNLDGNLGWSLLGTNENIPAQAVSCDQGEVQRVWKFDGNWKLFVEGVDISRYPNMFDTIFANEGFWVKCK